MKPKIPFSWYGGKYTIAPQLTKLFPEHGVYVEPFCKEPPIAGENVGYGTYLEVVNNIDSNLINFFRVLRDEKQCHKLQELIELTPHSRDEKYDAWFKRDDECGPVIRAWRFFITVNQGWSGCYGKSWGFDRQQTKRSSKWHLTKETLLACSNRLWQVQIENENWKKIIERYDSPETLFNLDPPYLAESRQSPQDYEHEFSDDDHRQLLTMLQTIKGKATIFGYESELHNTELEYWTKKTFDVRLTAASNEPVCVVLSFIKSPSRPRHPVDSPAKSHTRPYAHTTECPTRPRPRSG